MFLRLFPRLFVHVCDARSSFRGVMSLMQLGRERTTLSVFKCGAVYDKASGCIRESNAARTSRLNSDGESTWSSRELARASVHFWREGRKRCCTGNVHIDILAPSIWTGTQVADRRFCGCRVFAPRLLISFLF